MCTVTYIPLAGGAVLTSSRDEHSTRGVALPPAIYPSVAGHLIYPTDTKAGGSWFVVQHTGVTGILLNGAFAAHLPAPSYRKSRGVLMIELLGSGNVYDAIDQFSFVGIEPFTLVLWKKTLLMEYRWDGRILHRQQKNVGQAHIWSSATLYNPQMQQERLTWFSQWLDACPNPGLDEMLAFHAQSHNTEYGIRMRRSNGIATASITSARIQAGQLDMHHKDLASGVDFVLQSCLPFSTATSDITNYETSMVQSN